MFKVSKNKRRLLCIIIIVLMVVNIGNPKMLTVQAAGATYNPQKAIEYAAAHWDDGVGECATFVSNCVIAGGINMKVNSLTDRMMKAICNATGLQIQDLALDSYKHATKAANEGKLAAGDVVGLYCVTCGETPHVLFCGGFDSNGRALYYAHNNPKNMQLFQIKDTSLIAKHSGHKIVGKVIHLSGLPMPNEQFYTLYLNPNQGCFSNGSSTTIKMEPQLIYGGGNWWDISAHMPTKEGYFFNGWYTEPVGGTRVYDYEGKACNEGNYFSNNTYVHSGDLTVYAQWSKYYDLYLDPNGGSFSNGTTEVTKASPQLIYEGGHWWDVSGHTPIKAGCTFKGWFTEAIGGVKVYNADGSACNEGQYFSNNLYVNPGDLKVYAQWSETEKPVITDVWVDEVSNQGYTVYCKATDNTQILKVSFATWTEYNDQDDLRNEWWDKNAVMQPVSGNTYAFRVNTSEHNEEGGLYITDVYAYDTNYNYVSERVLVNIDKTSPIISYYIENVDATGYTVVCKAVDDVEMARVCFPTWTTANGQDDLELDWYNNCAVVGKGNDGVYTYRVNVSDHNNESGEYETHIYAYDTSGNYIQGRAPKTQVPKGLPFPDVKPGAWYYNSVAAVYEVGLMNGRADGTFGPNLNLTRAEVATVLYNKENKPYVAYVNRFSDVKDGMWYSAPISWAYRKGIASGYGNGKFGVGDNISREQMAQMLYAYAKMKGYDVSYTDGAINQYGDSSKVSSWAKPAMNWAISKGVMSGKGSGSDLSKYKLEPQGSTTRAECAAMLKNFMDVYRR